MAVGSRSATPTQEAFDVTGSPAERDIDCASLHTDCARTELAVPVLHILDDDSDDSDVGAPSPLRRDGVIAPTPPTPASMQSDDGVGHSPIPYDSPERDVQKVVSVGMPRQSRSRLRTARTTDWGSLPNAR
mmetsp:Transcript_23308/g.61007  ORF Transcript_23308/g.61007 Transcript_23308/m.61007 type:complete len:131 (+) Transcript_23308:3-395(+)